MVMRYLARCAVAANCLLLAIGSAHAQLLDLSPAGGKTPRLTLEAHLSSKALRPEQRSVLALVVEIAEPYHAQSHKPLDPNLIPFEVKLEPIKDVDFGAVQYPPGKIEEYKALGKLSVYSGKTIIYVPITPRAGAAPGSVKIKGVASYQICDDKSCFPPEEMAFSLDTPVTADPSAATENRPELFKDFKAAAAQITNDSPAAKDAAPQRSSSIIIGDQPTWSFPVAMCAAFLAGILFNIVPCVLPVLPIKVLGFAEVAQHDRGKTLLLSSIFGLGIVTVFAVLAMFILVFKTISWGQQFANPIFAWLVVALLLALSLWLFGILNINLPPSAYAFAPRHDTYFGNYLWGILTAVLSTPCTGPLFPPLMLWARTQPAAIGVPAFMMVGVGMAFPYVALSAVPEVARRFPRVGPWPELFKQMLGFVLLAFTVFFAAGRFTSNAGQWWCVVPVAAMAALYLMARTVQLSKNARAVAISSGLSVAIVAASVLIALQYSGAFDSTTGTARGAAVDWIPYSDDALESSRKAGNIVLVKFTANWCLNCQYVEATVFHDPRAIDSLHKNNVVTLKADLTKQDAAGWPRLRQLSSTGGIPLTAIYAPGRDQPIQIASVYTTDTLVKTLQQLASSASASASADR